MDDGLQASLWRWEPQAAPAAAWSSAPAGRFRQHLAAPLPRPAQPPTAPPPRPQPRVAFSPPQLFPGGAGVGTTTTPAFTLVAIAAEVGSLHVARITWRPATVTGPAGPGTPPPAPQLDGFAFATADALGSFTPHLAPAASVTCESLAFLWPGSWGGTDAEGSVLLAALVLSEDPDEIACHVAALALPGLVPRAARSSSSDKGEAAKGGGEGARAAGTGAEAGASPQAARPGPWCITNLHPTASLLVAEVAEVMARGGGGRAAAEPRGGARPTGRLLVARRARAALPPCSFPSDLHLSQRTPLQEAAPPASSPRARMRAAASHLPPPTLFPYSLPDGKRRDCDDGGDTHTTTSSRGLSVYLDSPPEATSPPALLCHVPLALQGIPRSLVPLHHTPGAAPGSSSSLPSGAGAGAGAGAAWALRDSYIGTAHG